MKIGLFFGTFNPIHVGHLIIANHMAEHSDLDQVWVVVTPQSPHKKKQSLLDNHQRLEMVYRATKAYPKLKPSAIEFDLPQPNYTVHTLAYLEEKYPEHHFALIMGEDNLRSFKKWKNHEEILKSHQLYIYPRILTEQEKLEKYLNIPVEKHSKIIRCDAPVMKISSSFIRKAISENKDVRYLLTPEVFKYVDEMNFYKNIN